MPGVVQVTKTGPRTKSPLAGQTVRGGRLVEAAAAGRIREAQAASVIVLGVALTDAIAPEDVNTAATIVNGRPVLNTVVLPTTVAVAYGGDEVPVVYSANAPEGAYLVATAAGTVGPAGATPDARTIVGKCTEPGGVVFATNPVGLVRLAI